MLDELLPLQQAPLHVRRISWDDRRYDMRMHYVNVLGLQRSAAATSAAARAAG